MPTRPSVTVPASWCRSRSRLFRAVCDFELPKTPSGADGCAFAAGIAFLPRDPAQRADAKDIIAQIVAGEGLELLGWRTVPTTPVHAGVGQMAVDVMPVFEQLFLAAQAGADGVRPYGVALDRLIFPARKRIEHQTAARPPGASVYFPSLSSRTITYKGMLTTEQLPAFYPDLTDVRMESAIAIVHSRFSTNTFPAWPLAHPFRYIAHNGEINTVRGNRNWMRAREALLKTDLIAGDLSRIYPICTDGASDSASFDEVLELLHLSGRSLPHAMMMMIPEAWENNPSLPGPVRGFHEFHACLTEPWDGPACVTFTDGQLLGAVLDRNGLRPGRWWRTDHDTVVLASESGVLPIPPENVVERGRLQPGRMFLIDTVAGRVLNDAEVKGALAMEHPYAEWVHAGTIALADLPTRKLTHPDPEALLQRQQTFGYTDEDIRVLLTPMAASGAEGIGSMGTDTPEAVMSGRSRMLFDYFTQLFAQVTNPPLDAVREQVVTSLASVLGPEGNLLEPNPASCRVLVLPLPVVDNVDLARIVGVNSDGDVPGLAAAVIPTLYEVGGGAAALRDAIEAVRAETDQAVAAGAHIIVLSDRDSDDVHGTDPVAADHLRGAPAPGAAEDPHQGRPRGGGRRCPRGAPRRAAARLRRGRGEPVPGVGDCRRSGPPGSARPERVRVQGRQERGVRDVQGRAQGDEQDGHLHRRVLHRCAGVRGVRPRPGRARRVLHRHLRRRPAGPASTSSPPTCRTGTDWPTGTTTPPGSTAASRSAATTSGAARASCTCSTRRRCTCCSTPPGPSRRASSAATPTPWTGCPARAARCAGCSGSAPRSAPRCRWRTSSRRRRSSSVSSPGRCPTGRSRPRRTRRSPSR